MRALTLISTVGCLLATGACGDDGGGGSDGADEEELSMRAPDVGEIDFLTDSLTLVPVTTPLDNPDARKPVVPAELQEMLDDGFGKTMEGPGEPSLERVSDGSTPPQPGDNPVMLTRFAHMPDLQLADDESPGRALTFESTGPLGGSFRPQESYMCHMIDAMVQTMNQVNEARPLDFVLLGGDNADSAQHNEVGWVLDLLGGGVEVHCDSGEDDDPIPGPDNDGKDPLQAVGLDMPWLWVTGNHDILIQGTAAITPEYRELIVSTEVTYATRDWSMEGGPSTMGPIIADDRRELVTRRSLLEKIMADGDGHGIGDDQVDSGKAVYTHDIPGSRLRLLVLDTAAETGAAEGVIHMADVEELIRPALDEALSDGKWVMLASHHAVRALENGGGFMGEVQDDALTKDEWLSVLGEYPNIIFSFVGHDHVNRIEYLGDGHQFWELTTSALADYPHQSRIIEIWDQDNGWLMLKATQVDVQPGNEIVEMGRELGVLDYVSGWTRDGSGTLEDRNVTLWIEKPAE